MKERWKSTHMIMPGIVADFKDEACGRSNDAGIPIIGISRHRIGVDGSGITTLVAFHGCPLRCKYCINPQCFDPVFFFPRYTPENLYVELQKDDLYFRTTGGGVTFGGGEPCLQADFIVRFREICGSDWKINIETSLNVDREYIEKLAPIVDEWIVDIKTDDPEKYLEYTGKDITPALRQLYYLVNVAEVPKDRILLRIPVIPGFIDEERAESTRQRFTNEGFTRFDIFTYRTEKPTDDTDEESDIGKAKCDILREIREEIARQTDSFELPPHNCTHIGGCKGTCPRCENEMDMLRDELRTHANRTINISDGLAQRINSFCEMSEDEDDADESTHLGGQIVTQAPPIYRKLFFKECQIAGLCFHLEKDDDLWFELDEGTKLALVRDYNNKHDRNAVAVALADDYDGDPDDFDFDLILGYIPRTENAEIATMMDAGYANKFSAEITTIKRYGSYNDRIRITIYLESREPVVQRPDLLRAVGLDYDSYEKLNTELKGHGFATFRWGGFPPEERNLPEVGDKIVILHEVGDTVVLHLMHVLMAGEDCLKLDIDRDEIFATDDCIHFALTNVLGPKILNRSSLGFLTRPNLQEYSAQEYLTDEESDAFKRMFGITHAINHLE